LKVKSLILIWVVMMRVTMLMKDASRIGEDVAPTTSVSGSALHQKMW
jgi:hypothetical protein